MRDKLHSSRQVLVIYTFTSLIFRKRGITVDPLAGW